MSFMFNGVQAQVTISGSVSTSASLNAPLATQTIVYACNASGKSGDVITGNVKMRDVTAGKTFYLTHLNVTNATGAGSSFELRDNGAGGTMKYSAGIVATGNLSNVYLFPTPLPFTTNVYLVVNVNGGYLWTVEGFEQ